jgi:Tfp pilus assembly protein PilO
MAAAKKSPKDLLGGINPNAAVVAGWVVAVVAVLALYYFVFYEPLDEERAREEARKTSLQQEFRTAEGNLRRYNTDVAELARARQRAQQLQTVLPNDPDIPGFMRSVNALSEASGLQLSLIQPVEERVEQYYARIPVQLEVRGSYLSLARFFHSVSQLPRVINMENIKLPYAMVTDPSGRGTILRRGMLVGRREVVRNSDGQDYFVHWRVARVLQARLRRTQDGQLDEHPAELVFERTDPSNRSSQLTERSLALGAMRNESVATSTTALPSSVVIPGVGNNAPSYLPNNLGGAGQTPTPSSVMAGGRPPPPTTTTTTVVVQAPPAPAPQVREIPPTQTPPAVRVTGGESPLNNR